MNQMQGFRKSLLTEKPLVLDGGLGSIILAAGYSEDDYRSHLLQKHSANLRGLCDILCLTRPDDILRIHQKYLLAGANILTTNTFNSTVTGLAPYALDKYAPEICREAVSICRQAISTFAGGSTPGKTHMIAGCLGPTHISLTKERLRKNPRSNPQSMTRDYFQSATALIESGADLLLLESVYDLENARAACNGILLAFEHTGKRLPLMISMALSPDGTLFSGESMTQASETLVKYHPLSLGINCGGGPKESVRQIRQLSQVTILPLSVHPSAGLPDKSGNYAISPESWLTQLAPILDLPRLKVVGGCCGTTPNHISLLVKKLNHSR